MAKLTNYVLWEIYFFCFRLVSRYRKWFLFHLMGFFSFILSGIKHLRRGNKKTMKDHLLKGVPEQFLSMIGRFPK
jgi:hypothetical protein